MHTAPSQATRVHNDARLTLTGSQNHYSWCVSIEMCDKPAQKIHHHLHTMLPDRNMLTTLLPGNNVLLRHTTSVPFSVSISCYCNVNVIVYCNNMISDWKRVFIIIYHHYDILTLNEPLVVCLNHHVDKAYHALLCCTKSNR